jgi:hypothetical protein
MEPNYFILRRDEELQWAASASCDEARKAHTTMAALFEDAAKKSGGQTPPSRKLRTPPPRVD